MPAGDLNQGPQTGADEERQTRPAVAGPRLLPAVTFGLRAAVLAGMIGVAVIPAGAGAAAGGAPVIATARLGGAVPGAVDTSCCAS